MYIELKLLWKKVPDNHDRLQDQLSLLPVRVAEHRISSTKSQIQRQYAYAVCISRQDELCELLHAKHNLPDNK